MLRSTLNHHLTLVADAAADLRAEHSGAREKLWLRLRHEAEHTRQHTVEQAKRMLAAGRSQDEVLEFLSNTLMNRLIHAPSQRLRDAAETGDNDVVDTISQIYKLDAPQE